jgi:phage-related protein
MALVAGLVLLVTHWQAVYNWLTTSTPGVVAVFKTAWNDALAAFSAIWQATVKTVQGWANWFNENVVKWLKARSDEMVKWWHDHSQQITQIWGAMWATLKTAAKVWWAFTSAWLDVVKSAFRLAWDSLRDIAKIGWSAVSGIIKFYLDLVKNVVALALDVVTGRWSKVWGDLKKLVGQALGDVVSVVKNVAKGFGSLLYDAGKDLIRGLINGIKSMGGAAVSAAKDIAHSVAAGAKHAFGIKSPSRVFAEIGRYVSEGMAVGITAHAGKVETAVARLSQSTLSLAASQVDAFAPTLTGGGMGAPAGIQSGPAPVVPMADTGRVSVVHNHVTVNVAGSVRSDRDLRDMFQQEMLRLNGRNTSNGLTFKR